MVLESTIVCVDNSEYSRNGDFAPSRFAVQKDSANLICTTKLDSHPENTVGLLTSAGKSARILVTSTQDVGSILASLHSVKFDGASNLTAAIQKAQLALKHRQNQAQRQRIVMFVCSPVKEEKDNLVRLGKVLKKNNVAVDIVNVGEEGPSIEKIDAFIEAVNSSNNSHALHVQAGPHIVADLLMNSDIMVDREAASASGNEGGGNDFPFGVDPNVDPDLAMVLRISAEEERARQEALRRSEGGSSEEETASGETANADSNATSTVAATNEESTGGQNSVDASLSDDVDLYGTGEGMEVDKSGSAGDADMEEDEEMDESMRAAIEMSKEDFKEDKSEKKDKDGKDGESDSKKG